MKKDRITSELKNRLWQAHEDYGQGKTQNFSAIMHDCAQAANLLEDYQSKLECIEQECEIMRKELEEREVKEKNNLLKEFEEKEYLISRLRNENVMLKECVVRMCMGRYGVLNEQD